MHPKNANGMVQCTWVKVLKFKNPQIYRFPNPETAIFLIPYIGIKKLKILNFPNTLHRDKKAQNSEIRNNPKNFLLIQLKRGG